MLEHTFDSWFDSWFGLMVGLMVGLDGRGGWAEMSKRYDEEVRVEHDAGMPAAFEWRGRRYEVRDVIGRWRIEGRWWADGRDREYWRVEAKGGAVWDLYHDRLHGRWHVERLWD
jgi:hypothetical protein